MFFAIPSYLIEQRNKSQSADSLVKRFASLGLRGVTFEHARPVVLKTTDEGVMPHHEIQETNLNDSSADVVSEYGNATGTGPEQNH